jgi:dTDP-glucose 4,6-dehydratase
VSTRSFIHIDDVSRATWAIAQQAPIGETYHISTDRVIAIKDLVSRMCDMLGCSFDEHVKVVGERLGKDSAYWLKSDKLRQGLGWTDQISLEQGLEETLHWAQSNREALTQQPMQYIHKP